MKTITLETSGRYLRRNIYERVKKSYVKIISELVTNSDESYKRLDEIIETTGGNRPSTREIHIYVNRCRKTFEVVDMAEGMSAEKMERVFKYYGAEKETHSDEGRGLFGQGLADVLLSQKSGRVSSIKDRKLTVAEFRWQRRDTPDGKGDQQPVVKIRDPRNVTEEDRQQLHIPHGNGTNVSFELIWGNFPQRNKLIESLSNYYILRLINSNSNRIVKVFFLDKKGEITSEDILKFTWPKGELLDKIETDMDFEGHRVHIRGEVYRAENPLPQKNCGEDRVGGLLVYDSNSGSVLDLTLFDFDESPYADHLYGKLELQDAYKLIRERMNSEQPEEILTDSRDGLKRSHPFTQELSKIVSEWLRPFVDAEKKKRSVGSGSIDEETAKRTQKALCILNKLYSDINKEVRSIAPGPGGEKLPENGLEFDRHTTEIVVDKEYQIGLRIDTNVFKPGTEVAITSNNPRLDAGPKVIVVKEPKKDNAVVSMAVFLLGKSVGVNATITATIGSVSSSLEVKVIPEEKFYPSSGMEFKPKNVSAKPNKWGELALYVDTSLIAVDSIIQLQISADPIMVKEERLTVRATDMVYDNVAKLKIEYRGTSEGQKSKITASCGPYSAEGFINIRTANPPTAGFIRDWEFEIREGDPALTFIDTSDGIVRLNLAHPILAGYFGRNVDEAKKRFKEQFHCQVVVADILLEEFLYYTMAEAYRNNRLDYIPGYEPWEIVKRYIIKKKSEIGWSFIEAFIDRRLREEAI